MNKREIKHRLRTTGYIKPCFNLFTLFTLFTLFVQTLIPAGSYAQIPDGITTIRPNEIDEVLMNPGIGFTTFQMFNGDNHQANQDVLREADLDRYQNDRVYRENTNHPLTTIAYFRILWSVIEPDQGEYRWDYIDGLLHLAHEHGQTLALRISPYKGRPIDDVPDWYREMVGDKREFKHVKWPVDPENPLYAKHFGNMIRELGKRYDGHPDLESVDLSFVGWAGEGGGTNLLSEETMHKLVDSYLESFTKTPLLALLSGKKAVEYMNSKANIGWRQDCLGDLDFWADEQNGWTHMYDYYPQTIAGYNMGEAWKKAHVSFEICGTMPRWKSDHGYGLEEVQYIIDQSLKWHISSFNGKSAEVPQEWQPLVDEWLKKMGYRFVLRKFSYPAEAQINGKLPFQTWWENKGVAPCYGNYTLSLRLVSGDQAFLLPTDADIKQWLPGDIVYENAVFIPADIPAGSYEIQIGILDPMLRGTRINLAIEGRTADGWYSLGPLKVN